jgi:SAM-dependent methyltransferase
MFRKQCLCCGSDDLKEIIDLGMHPMADTFVSAQRLSEGDRVYPLICDLCPRCCQIQLRASTDPEERYVKADYSYTSSNSQTSRSHWDEFAQSVASQLAIPQGATVVEIGSNDGYLLKQFQAQGFDTLGIEPSPVMAEMARSAGIETERAFFSLGLAQALGRRLKAKPLLIAANNVFNHANDPVDFAKGIKALLDPLGTYVFELPYWLCSIEQGKFDQIYHEHVSYFTVSYAINLFKQLAMTVVRAEEVDYHGGSIRVFVRHEGAGAIDPSVEAFVARERKAELFSESTYAQFMARILDVRNRFLPRLYELKLAGHAIVCAGAAAKGNTFLNFYNLDSTLIDWVTDSSPSRINPQVELLNPF